MTMFRCKYINLNNQVVEQLRKKDSWEAAASFPFPMIVQCRISFSVFLSEFIAVLAKEVVTYFSDFKNLPRYSTISNFVGDCRIYSFICLLEITSKIPN